MQKRTKEKRKTLSRQVCEERSKKRREREEFERLSCELAAEQQAERLGSREAAQQSADSLQGEQEEQREQNLPSTRPQEDEQLGVDFGGEQEENVEERNEPQSDLPFSNIHRIYNYLTKEGEHRLLELKNQVTDAPCVFGARVEKVPVPENKEEMAIFLKKLVQLREGMVSEEQLLATINRESGAKDYQFRAGCVPGGAKFYYCLKHGGEPVFSDKEFCGTCIELFQTDHPGEVANLINSTCLYGFKYNVGEGIANVLNNLAKEDRERFLENHRKSRTQTFQSFLSEGHNIFDMSSGLSYISALESGLAEGVDLFLNLCLSVDGVEVRKSGATYRKVYPVWIVLNDLPVDLRFAFFFQQL